LSSVHALCSLIVLPEYFHIILSYLAVAGAASSPPKGFSANAM